ncbi:MAG: tail fiber protein [Candidatus Aenigmatarchaeota archaeon]
MKRVLACLVLLLFIGIGYASVSSTIPMQGRLLTQNGNPLTGLQNMTFKIYDVSTGGQLLWSESGQTQTTGGLFSVVLGEDVSLTLTFDRDYYVEIIVNGETLLPRQKLLSSPYAQSAKNVYGDIVETKSISVIDTDNTGLIYLGRDLNQAIGATIRYLQSGDYLGLRTSHEGPDHVVIKSDGKVGIGTSTPVEKLDVMGNIKVSGNIFKNYYEFKANGSGYKWIRIPYGGPYGGQNYGGLPIHLIITRSILDDNSIPYGGPSLDLQCVGREWHFGQQYCTAIYGYHGSSGAEISHVAIRDLSSNGVFIFLRIHANVTYKIWQMSDSGYIKPPQDNETLAPELKDAYALTTGLNIIGDNTPNLHVAGNVGIGTSTPSEKLDISGNVHVSGNLIISGSGAFDGRIDANLINTSTVITNNVTASGYRFSDGTIQTTAASTSSIFPAGTILNFAGSDAPSGFLICNGLAISRTQYAALFAIIRTTYGAGDGSTTFNIPNLAGRVPVGKSSESEFASLGQTGGEKTHILTTAEMPSHAHTGSADSAGSHTHTGSTNAAAMGGGGWGLTGSGWGSDQITHSHTLSINAAGAHTHTVTISSAGSSNAHNNMQPYIVLNYIIKY